MGREEHEEDERALRPGICGATQFGGTGIEWICIKEDHESIYTRKTSDRSHQAGTPFFTNNISTADAHFFVRRWPNRKKNDD